MRRINSQFLAINQWHASNDSMELPYKCSDSLHNFKLYVTDFSCEFWVLVCNQNFDEIIKYKNSANSPAWGCWFTRKRLERL